MTEPQINLVSLCACGLVIAYHVLFVVVARSILPIGGASYSVESLHVISLPCGKNIFVFVYKLNFVTLLCSSFTWVMLCLFTIPSTHYDPFSDIIIVGVVRNVFNRSWA